jgi:hypothetical protein
MNKTAGEESFPSLQLTDDAGVTLDSDLACCQDPGRPKTWWETQAVIENFTLPYTGTYFIKAAMIRKAGEYSLRVELAK